MRRLRSSTFDHAQRGFSLVELLLTAFIMAVGIMGLTLLQVMALRGARGGQSLATGVQVAEMVMDQIEMEGRLSWLNLTASQAATPAALTTLKYINKVPLADPLPFTIKGQVPVAGATDPADAATFYTAVIGQANIGTAGNGVISNFTVIVSFSDQANAPRQVRISRSILHG